MSTEPFSFSIAADSIPAKGRHFHLEADQDSRRRLALALDLPEVVELAADLDVKLLRDGVVSVRGKLSAAVVQTDVVTLEPIRQSVAEEIDVTLKPAERPATKTRDPVEGGTEPEQESDVYFDNRIDLGALTAEHLALGLDPYPRAPGVEFEPHVEDVSAGDRSPFAALSSLKGKE
jgi:hypothetical protein